jgi:hypothetical protein
VRGHAWCHRSMGSLTGVSHPDYDQCAQQYHPITREGCAALNALHRCAQGAGSDPFHC